MGGRKGGGAPRLPEVAGRAPGHSTAAREHRAPSRAGASPGAPPRSAPRQRPPAADPGSAEGGVPRPQAPPVLAAVEVVEVFFEVVAANGQPVVHRLQVMPQSASNPHSPV